MYRKQQNLKIQSIGAADYNYSWWNMCKKKLFFSNFTLSEQQNQFYNIMVRYGIVVNSDGETAWKTEHWNQGIFFPNSVRPVMRELL